MKNLGVLKEEANLVPKKEQVWDGGGPLVIFARWERKLPSPPKGKKQKQNKTKNKQKTTLNKVLQSEGYNQQWWLFKTGKNVYFPGINSQFSELLIQHYSHAVV